MQPKMIAPSLTNEVARQLLGRRELIAELLDDAKSAARVPRICSRSNSDSECRAAISGMIEGALQEVRIDTAGGAHADHQFE